MAEIDITTVKRTQETLGKFVKRPPLTEKLLLRPPFRFLHDIVTMVIKETGFLNGLYTEDELNSDNVKDRDAKTQFLDKLISVVNMVTGKNLSVRSAKIVAGLEVDKTNELLQALGEALEKKLDSTKAVESVIGGNVPKVKVTEKASVKKESTKKDTNVVKPKAQNGTATKDEKSKARVTGTSNSKTSVKKEATAVKSKEKPLKEKVAAKPVKAVGKPTAAPKTNNPPPVKKEAKPIKVKEKEISQKPNVVEEQVALTTPIDKIVENGHIEETPPAPQNDQLFENLVLGEPVVEEPLNTTETVQPTTTEKLEKEFEPKVEVAKLETLKRSDTRDELSAIIDAEAEMRKKERKAKRSGSKHRQPPESESPKEETSVLVKQEEEVTSTPERPRTARKSPRERKPEEPSPHRDSSRTIRQSSVEAQPKERPAYVRQPTDIDKTANRPRTSLRPPSVRPASARPAAPTRRRDKNIEIVLQPEEQVQLGTINVKMQSFNNDLEDDGENLVVIEDPTIVQDNVAQDSGVFSGSGLDTNGEDSQQQGHLVQQILETQTQFSTSNDAESTRKTTMEWEMNGQKLTYTKQMESIRDSIQKITRSVNPLGKLMDFLQEDIDSMQRELELWQDRYTKANVELKREKELTLTAMDPLRHQLVQVADNIKEHKDLIDASRANILQNEHKIYKLLTEM